jgi:hypothetical protein
MRHLTLGLILIIGVATAAGHAGAQSAPPAKVCKNLLGKVIPCPAAKTPAPVKPAAVAPTAPKPGLLSRLAAPAHPMAPSAPSPMAKPSAPMAAPAPHAVSASGYGSQTSRIGATAICNDGTYWRSKTHAGACSRHNGVAVFY